MIIQFFNRHGWWVLIDIAGLIAISLLGLELIGGLDISSVTTPQKNIWIASIFVFAIATFMLYQQRVPIGFRSLGMAVPAITALFGLMLLAIVILRIDYSRSALIVFFLCSSVWFQFRLGLMFYYARKKFWLIPQGQTYGLPNIRGPVSCSILKNAGAQPSNMYDDGIIANLKSPMEEKWNILLTRANLQGVPIYDASAAYESLSGRVPIERLKHKRVNILSPPKYYMYFKRLLDIVLVSILLVLTAPFFLVCTVVIWLDSPGKIFFVQKRIGLGAKKFNMFKFRTMLQSTSENRFTNSTKPQDMRITRIGNILRRFRLDELPQLFNVFRGDMSLVGPRPAVVEVNARYLKKIPLYQHRHLVHPGITGWAQISQGYVLDEDNDSTLEKIERDFYYIKHMSLWLDIMILIFTITTILGGRGAR